MTRFIGHELRCPHCDCLLLHEAMGERPDECPDCHRRLAFDDWFPAEPITDDDLLTLREPYC